MSKTIKKTFTHLAIGMSTAGGVSVTATPALADDTQWAGFVENATYVRDGVGLSKFRNTAQGEFEKSFEVDGLRSLKLNGVLRGSYDGVYDLNDDEFGKDTREPYLGSNWHGRDTSTAILAPGVTFPCENNPTLCRNLSDYMDQTESDVRFPEFNDELDFLREFYLTADKELDNGDLLTVRVGKQQIVWGKTDLFRVLDVINPVDYSRHNIYDELEDIRIPQWMVKAEWRMGPTAGLDESNLSMIWNIDQFRPSNLGTCGQPYRMMDGACFFSSYLPTGAPMGALPPFAVDVDGDGFGDIPIVHRVDRPNWSLSNTQLGFKWEGVYRDLTFSLNALTYRQQTPSLHWRGPDVATPALDGVFDVKFPRVNLIGGSADYYAMDMDAIWRMEIAYSEGEELPRDAWGHQETDMLRYVIGFDKSLMIPALGSASAFQLSAQLFGEHILDHVSDMPNDADNWIATALFKGWYMNNRLSPQIVIAHDFAAEATVMAPSISWSPNDNWMFNVGLNIKHGGNQTFPWSVAQKFGDTSGQYEPLARFLNGPVGVANEEDELQFTVRYSF